MVVVTIGVEVAEHWDENNNNTNDPCHRNLEKLVCSTTTIREPVDRSFHTHIHSTLETVYIGIIYV